MEASPGSPEDEVRRAEAGADGDGPTEAATPGEVFEPEGGPDSPARGESPLAGQADSEDDPFAERPEVFVGAAFAGGLVAALILRSLGRS